MKKKMIFMIMFVPVMILLNSCDVFFDGTETANLQDLQRVSDRPHIISMSTEETERLKALFSNDSGWTEVSCCDCILEGQEYGYELTLDNMCYRICTTEYTDHPISYKKIGGEYKNGLINENKEIVTEVNSIISNRNSLGSDYEAFLNENQKRSKQAAVRYKQLPDIGEKTDLSKEDTERLRTLLSLESGWTQQSVCQCMGYHELILDNVGYMIDLKDVDHQIKVCLAGDNRYIAIVNENKEVVKEIYEIVEKYIE